MRSLTNPLELRHSRAKYFQKKTISMPKDNKAAQKTHLRPRINISKAAYDPVTHKLTVSGWRLKPDQGPVRIVISSPKHGELGEAEQNKERADVARKFPDYNDKTPGWVFEATLPDLDQEDELMATLIHSKGKQNYRAPLTLKGSPKSAAESERFRVTTCAYDTESKFLRIAGEAYPELPPRRLRVVLGNGRSEVIEKAFLPSSNITWKTGGILNRFGGFEGKINFLGQGALSSVTVTADLIDGGEASWSIASDDILYDQPLAEISEVTLDFLRDRIEVNGWYRSYSPVTSINLHMNDQKIHGIPELHEDADLSRKLGFRGPLVQRFRYDLSLSDAVSDPEKLADSKTPFALTLFSQDQDIGRFYAAAPAVQMVTAKATCIMFDRRNSLLLVWGECAPGTPPSDVTLEIAGRQIGEPLKPVLSEADPTAEISSWFIAEEVNFELSSDHKIDLKITSGKTGSAEVLLELPKPIIVSAEKTIASHDTEGMAQAIYDHNCAERRLPEPVACFVLQGSMLGKGGGSSRIRNMMHAFKNAGYSVALIDRTAPWEYKDSLDDYKKLRQVCDCNLMIPQAYKSDLLNVALKNASQEAAPSASHKNLKRYLERAKKEGRILRGNGEGLYKRVDSHFNYAAAAFLHHLRPDVAITQFAWSCEIHNALPENTVGLIDTHDVQSARFENFADAHMRYGSEAIPSLDKFDVDRETEQKFLNMADACIAISPDEKSVLDDMIGARNTVLATPSSDNTVFMGSPADSRRILFIGNNYEANNFGILKFLNESWPEISKAIDGVQLDIVGSCGASVARFADHQVHVHGVVQDLTPFYEQAAVIINPVLFGTGIAVKMIESLSRGKASVSTTVGARGLGQATSSGAIKIADDPAEFSKELMILLKDPKKRLKVERLAFDYVKTYMQPEITYSNLFNFLETKIFYRCCLPWMESTATTKIVPMLPKLPVYSAFYDHALGRIGFNLHPQEVTSGSLFTLVVGEHSYHTKLRIVPAKAGSKERAVAVFQKIWLHSDSDKLVLIGTRNGEPAAYAYVPQKHKLRNWENTKPFSKQLTFLLSFPRSGSNFVQNVIKQNSVDIACSSIYRGGRLADKDHFLKSHALDADSLANELSHLWHSTNVTGRQIILTRDPRDVFISLYDYVAGLRNTAVEPSQFLQTDFYWYLFRPDVLNVIRDAQHSQTRTVLQAYQDWFRVWAQNSENTNDVLHIRYEALIADPQSGFRPIFEMLDIPPPTGLSAVDEIVSLNGESDRTRGKAGGWRHAPKQYAPIIAQVEKALGPQIEALGY